MGKVMSMISRKVNRFNVENRAHRLLERDKLEAAPKYESNLRDMQRALELDPDVVQKLNEKNEMLDERLKKVYVTSEDSVKDHAAERRNDPNRPLPLSRITPEDFEYGFKEPTRISHGRYTLRQAMKFIIDHQSEPEVWTKLKIASDYKLKEELVDNILRYYKGFNVYIPDKGQRESILTQAKTKLLENKQKEEK